MDKKKSHLTKLWEDFHAGSNEARTALISHYNYLVRTTRLRIISSTHHISAEDLDQEGMIALCKAVDRFSPNRNVKFTTYATCEIRGAIYEYIRKQDFVSRSTRDRGRMIERAIDELTGQLNRKPTHAELAVYFGQTVDEFDEFLAKARPYLVESLDSLFRPPKTYGDLTLADTIGAPDTLLDDLATQLRNDRLVERISKLSNAERTVLEQYYFGELTFLEIAQRLDRSQTRIWQLHKQAIGRLAKSIREPEHLASPIPG